jgi:hypothetical protein
MSNLDISIKEMIYIQNVPSRNDPTQNGTCITRCPISKEPITKHPTSREQSRNGPEQDMNYSKYSIAAAKSIAGDYFSLEKTF